jgi:DNA-binding transcriptional regulator LsrR (DeoR family)
MPEDRNDVSDAVIYRVAELYLTTDLVAKQGVKAVAERVNREFANVALNRHSPNILLVKAVKRGLLRLVAPAEQQLEARIRTAFGVKKDIRVPDINNVTVVDCPRPESSDAVSAAAADVAYKLIKWVAEQQGNNAVGLGLGPGRATLSFSQSLSDLLRQDTQALKLNLFGISSSCLAHQPHFAPVSFFNLFPTEKVSGTLALFSQALVRSKDFKDTQTQTGVREVFEKKDKIDIVVTSMGNMLDEHTLYRMFMYDHYKKPMERPAWLKTCVGDVQYRPFSKDGPIHEKPNDRRLVTLFELEELVAMANSLTCKFVVLIARQCGKCETQSTRAKALLPIMTNPKLKLFTHVVMDSPTAEELLKEFEKTKPKERANPAPDTSSKAP